jgi:hypothetical protein
MIDFGGNVPDLPAGSGERLVMTTVRPVLPTGRVRLTSTPADTGWCRRPRPGRTAGYVVNRKARGPVLAGELLTEDDLEPAPWAVGDQVDVIPLSEPATRCGRCWACRGRGLVDGVRRRNVKIAVVAMMVGPVLLFVAARWWL